MAPFRRPGLQDDEEESQPDMLRPRASPSIGDYPAYSAAATHVQVPSQSFAGDEDSVVSGLSAMSDLESLYLESSSKNQPKNARDQYLLAQRLPCKATSVKEYRGPPNLLNGFATENEDEEDNWEDMVYVATLQQSHQPQDSPKQQPIIDPAEQERLDMNRAIAESRLFHEKEEEMRLAQILEDDEEAPYKEKKSRKFPSKNSKKKDKKGTGIRKGYNQDATGEPKKKGGLWSSFAQRKNPKR